MRRWLAVGIALGIGALAGCFSGQPERSTARLHAPAFTGPVGDDVVFVDVAVIERPLGDAFLNRDLWSETDEQAVRADDDEQAASLERKTVLEKNGFRVGQVGSLMPPGRLLDLLTSSRSCQPRRVETRAGSETAISLGPLQARCRCQVAHDERTTIVDLTEVQCLLDVTPILAEEGRIHLRCTPRIKHGKLKSVFAPMHDAGGVLRWGRQEQQPEETYPWLSWTVAVTANEYVVIGTEYVDGDTLGERFFVTDEERPAVQRLLVLRCARMSPEVRPATASLRRSPPLALRASMTMARGRNE